MHVLRIANERVRQKAIQWINAAPIATILKFHTKPTRTTEQNARMWAMLSDISKQVQGDRAGKTPEVWKMLFMHSLGHETRFEMGLNGEPFPVGFSSSNLSVKEMSDLIEWIFKWGAENGIIWSERGFDEPDGKRPSAKDG